MSVFFALAVAAQPIPDKQARLFLDFARDVSAADPDVMARARALVGTPPLTRDGIGFYGLEGAPAPERALRGIISTMVAEGHILSVEDKYIYELPLILEDQGLARFDGEPLKDVLNMFGASATHESAPTDAEWQIFRSNFGAHVRAIERAVQRTGHELLTLDVPLGDSFFVWIATPEKAGAWRNRQLYAGVNTVSYARAPMVSIKVTDPAWDVYWGLLCYAYSIPEAFWPVPDYE